MTLNEKDGDTPICQEKWRWPGISQKKAIVGGAHLHAHLINGCLRSSFSRKDTHGRLLAFLCEILNDLCIAEEIYFYTQA